MLDVFTLPLLIMFGLVSWLLGYVNLDASKDKQLLIKRRYGKLSNKQLLAFRIWYVLSVVPVVNVLPTVVLMIYCIWQMLCKFKSRVGNYLRQVYPQ